MTRTRRGTTLLEAVLVVVLLGIAVPPALSLMRAAAAPRADAVNAARASALAAGLLEQVLADRAAPGVGPQGIAASGYDADLAQRAAALIAPYEALGFSWSLGVSEPVGPEGAATGDPQQDRFRVVTVRVAYPLAGGGRIEMPVAAMVGGDAP